jgi:hypothetical protein
MPDNLSTDNVELETFLKLAGQSFSDAQKSLLPGVDVEVNMMLSNVELELKVAVSSDSKGKMYVKPISSEDITRGDINPGMISTLRINYVSSIGEVKPQKVAAVTDLETASRQENVPDLIGLSPDQAVAMMKKEGWQFESRPASAAEKKAAGAKSLGLIIRQQPAANQKVDKSKTSIEFWVYQASLAPVKTNDVIEKKPERNDKTSLISERNIGPASVSKASEVKNINLVRIQKSEDVMLKLTELGLKKEVAELLVKGAGISSVEQLAGASYQNLTKICQQAISNGIVRTPKGFTLNQTLVKSWVTLAGKVK